MAIGDLIRDLRTAHGVTQLQLADLLAAAASTDGTPTVSQVKKWENGKVIPGPFWITYLSQVLDVAGDVLTAEASLSRMKRRAFLSLTALAATHGTLARDMLASVAGADAGPLASVQTTHGTDLVIASLTDSGSARYLRRWMRNGDSATPRVNAAGILAKMPGRDCATDVVRVLQNDYETQHGHPFSLPDWPRSQSTPMMRARDGAPLRCCKN